MKNYLLIFLLCSFPLYLFSQQSTFDYVEGEVTIKRASGELFEAQIDDMLNIGDSVITGEDGFAELQLENSSRITIDNDTVFVFSKKEKKGEKKSIFMVVLGKIKFKFDRLLNEPDIQTPTTVAGIRGTEFTVVSALDGSALYVVDEGSVAVESEGTLVVLETEEAVEVPIGEAPGKNYEVKSVNVDFQGWLDDGENKFTKDPANTLASVTDKLIEFSNEALFFLNEYDISKKQLDIEYEEMIKIGDGKGNEEKSEFYKNIIQPLERLTTNNALNYRYYGLSGMSLRRYVIAYMYIEMKTKYVLDIINVEYLDFMKEYDKFLYIYEENITKTLVEADI